MMDRDSMTGFCFRLRGKSLALQGTIITVMHLYRSLRTRLRYDLDARMDFIVDQQHKIRSLGKISPPFEMSGLVGTGGNRWEPVGSSGVRSILMSSFLVCFFSGRSTVLFPLCIHPLVTVILSRALR